MDDCYAVERGTHYCTALLDATPSLRRAARPIRPVKVDSLRRAWRAWARALAGSRTVSSAFRPWFRLMPTTSGRRRHGDNLHRRRPLVRRSRPRRGSASGIQSAPYGRRGVLCCILTSREAAGSGAAPGSPARGTARQPHAPTPAAAGTRMELKIIIDCSTNSRRASLPTH